MGHRLLPQLVVELVGQGLSCVESLLGRVDHQLGEQVQEKRVSLRKNLNKKENTLLHSRLLTLGNL
jgi:hypothetical protein